MFKSFILRPLKSKFGQIGSKTKILLDLLEKLRTSQFEGSKYEFSINILRFYIWDKGA